MSMNKAKKIYLDANGDMVKSVSKWDIEHFPDKYKRFDVESVVDRKKLRLVGLSYLNSGVTLWVEDEDGRDYPVTDSVFNKYLHEHPLDMGLVDFEYLQQGSTYSIGFVG